MKKLILLIGLNVTRHADRKAIFAAMIEALDSSSDDLDDIRGLKLDDAFDEAYDDAFSWSTT